MKELNHADDVDVDTFYANMDAAIQHAVDTVVPDVVRTRGVKRERSDKTKALYEKRTRMKGCTQGQYDDLQEEIKQSTLDDFKAWVESHCKIMDEANWRGDTRAIHKGAGLLCSVKDVASRWYGFL